MPSSVGLIYSKGGGINKKNSANLFEKMSNFEKVEKMGWYSYHEQKRSFMSRKFMSFGMVFLCSYLTGCASSEFFTVTIYDSPQRVVRLQTIGIEDSDGGYSHPSSVSKEQMAKVLQGLYVERDTTPLSRTGARQRAFSEKEINFFAPLFVKGLQQSTPEEVVTFFETAEISELQEATTSGGVFVKNNALHIILSNYGVKTQIWQDNDQYEAPYRLRPLESIKPEPGRLVFEPAQFMVQLEDASWFESLKGKPWHAAVSYLELP